MLMRSLSRRSFVLTAASSALAGCGFQLRGAPNLPFKAIYANFAPSSSLGHELMRTMESIGVRMIADNRQLNDAQAILDVIQDQREKTVVGVNASGQVREFQLRVRFKFKLRDLQGKELIPETELLQQRDISYSESIALSKEAEEALLYRNMQTDIVQQTLRRLSAVRS